MVTIPLTVLYIIIIFFVLISQFLTTAHIGYFHRPGRIEDLS